MREAWEVEQKKSCEDATKEKAAINIHKTLRKAPSFFFGKE